MSPDMLIAHLVKGNTLVDIREYYGAEGDEKPGKKGISLTVEQVRWWSYESF
jgi:Transcriptional Coactivator p15 (PC4)